MAENYTKTKARIMVYTRETDAAQYPAGLSRSIHLACSRDGKNYEALNNNYGILFAEAAHVLALELGQIIVDGHDMHAFAGERVEVSRHCCRQGQ